MPTILPKSTLPTAVAAQVQVFNTGAIVYHKNANFQMSGASILVN